MARTIANDPLQKFMFRVTVPGLPTGLGFQKVGGLTREVGVVEYLEGSISTLINSPAEKKSVKLPLKEVLMLQKNLKLSIRKCLRTLISVILSSLKFLTDLVIQSVPTSLLKLG